MAKEFSRKFYKSVAWKRCRESYISSKYGLCEKCEAPGKIVHHKILLTESNINDPNITLNFDNLELLCKSCHDKEEGHFLSYIKKSKPTREGYSFNENGEFIRVDTPPKK